MKRHLVRCTIVVTVASLGALPNAQAAPRTTHARSAHLSTCMARQSQMADAIERFADSLPPGPVNVRQNPALIELRTRCMPVHVCVNCPPPY